MFPTEQLLDPGDAFGGGSGTGTPPEELQGPVQPAPTPGPRWYDLPPQGKPLTTLGMFGSPLSSALSGAALASPIGRDILGAHFQQQNFETHQAQQQQVIDQRQQVVDLQKKHADREGLVQGVGLLKTIADMPVGSAQRKYASKKFGALWQGLTGQEPDADFLSMLTSSDEEDSKALKEGFDKLVAQFPELGIGGLSTIITKHPDLVIKLMGEAVKARKDQSAAQIAKDESEALRAIGASESTGSPPNSPGSPQTSPLPPTQPGGSQGPLRPASDFLQSPEGQATQQFVIQRAKALGIDPATAQGIIHTESGWDPKAVSPTGVVGLMQVTNKTGAPYGQTPALRTNPIASADVGLRHFADLLKQTNGNEDEALRRYGDPNDLTYVQKVRANAAQYKPHSQAVSEAPSNYQGSIHELDDELKYLGRKLKALRWATGEKANKLRDDVRQELQVKQKLMDSLEARYNTAVTPDFREWLVTNTPYRNPADIPQVQLNVYGQQYKKEKRQEKIDVSAAQGQNAVDRQPLSEKEQENLYTYNPQTGEQQRVPANWTQLDKRNAGKEGLKVVNLRPLSDPQQDQISIRTGLINNLDALSQDHAAITTGPVAGRLERWKLALGADVKDETAAQRLLLEKITNDKAFDKGGKNLTSNEIDRVKKELPADTDAPNVFQAKLAKALALTRQFHKLHNSAMRESGILVPKTYDVADAGAPQTGSPRDFDAQFNTVLTPNEEQQFQAWKARYAPRDSGADYDLRGAFKAGLTPDAQNGHFKDTFKKPNHPTFSDQSRYAPYGRPGKWNGDTFVPPQDSPSTTPDPLIQEALDILKGKK